ncbi:complement component C7 isoform X2 [Stegostoma tigrinum]|uniref:complement component C7 isoform X2 n=1 Tax=Stegostoma tigrinum TaxID=3053191 RepID=UPI0028703CD2|nr:complement component C7 isoform X2 [Stegostoma tigrinum]
MKLLLLLSMVMATTHGQYSAIYCQWGPFSPWSECEGCNNTQTRWRSVQDYAQFGGHQCVGSKFEFQSCSATRGCPVDEGCGDRFRCASGQCVSPSLRCNGDEDCEGDGADEMNCVDRKMACDIDKIPPQAELTGHGFDVIKGTFRGVVINTKFFGGTCRKVFSGDNREYYRLPESILQYTFQVKAKNDFKFRRYESSWSYLKVTRGNYAESGQGFFSSYSSNYDEFTNENNKKRKEQTYLTIENEVEVAQFSNSRPDKLQIPSSFHRDLMQLPAVYDYRAYRRVIELYGTHYLRKGALGGKYSMLFMVDKDKMSKADFSTMHSSSCSETSFNFIFISYEESKCEQYNEALRTAMGGSSGQMRGLSSTRGGRPAFVAALSLINVRDPQANSEVYQRWAASVKEYPVIINQKLAPLHELVKGVPCAGVKRHYLRRAIQQYIDELHPCKCRPCQNNGQAVVVGSSCQCFCKPYTFGVACEKGVLAQDQESGVGTAGGWSCWTEWTACLNDRRSRSRRCDNPPAGPGGRQCAGESSQSERCEDGEMDYLRQLEPHCFEMPIEPTSGCSAPPELENGAVQGLRAVYPVGSHAVYQCLTGYFFSEGDGTLRCGEDLHWEAKALECLRTVCAPPLLPADLIISPKKVSYRIGEAISLSCAGGSTLEGPSEILCDSSLQWSQDLSTIICDQEAVTQDPEPPQCAPWEKMKIGKCVCKMPYECSRSLPVCVVYGKTRRVMLLTLCKLLTLKCLGRHYELVAQSTCPSPAPAPASRCGSCSLGETCDEERVRCVCQPQEDCPAGGIRLCVLLEESEEKITVSECEAAVWRCHGRSFTIVASHPCSQRLTATTAHDLQG